MIRIGQIALGAALAICISGAAVRADVGNDWLNGCRAEAAQWQQAQMAASEKLAAVETAAIEKVETFIRAIVDSAR
jgi:hypothetical protein